MLSKIITAILLIITAGTSYAQDSLNVMFYNLYRFPDRPPANRENILKNILEYVQPDLFMVCELVNEQGAQRILNTSFSYTTAPIRMAAYESIQSPGVDDTLQQIVYYNSDKMQLVDQKVYPTLVRDINHYSFLVFAGVNNQDSIPLEVFVTHLKSSEGPANRQARLNMVDTFTKALNTLPTHHRVLFAGDFNFYSAYNEPGYQKILDTNNAIVMIDPIHTPGKWNDNDSFKHVHTQATRTSAAGFGIGGATGGLDDRFDFIMMSKNLETDSSTLWYQPQTYHALGINGNCFNKRIDDTTCTGTYPLALRADLHNMSDHTPVVMQLRMPKSTVVGVSNFSHSEPLISLPQGNYVHNQQLRIYSLLEGAQAYLYNMMGQRLQQLQLHKGTQIIDFSSLPSGIYILNVSINGQYQALKILKP
jgi:exonuclease III